MRTLLFLHRVTVIFNLFFLFYVFQFYTAYFTVNTSAQPIIILTGFIIAFIANLVIHLWELILVAKRSLAPIPKYIRVFNLLCFLLQIIFYFLLS